jgi:hypothetical protein
MISPALRLYGERSKIPFLPAGIQRRRYLART